MSIVVRMQVCWGSASPQASRCATYLYRYYKGLHNHQHLVDVFVETSCTVAILSMRGHDTGTS